MWAVVSRGVTGEMGIRNSTMYRSILVDGVSSKSRQGLEEAQRSVALRDEGAVQVHGVKVDVEVERAAEALDGHDAAWLRIVMVAGRACALCARFVEGVDGATGDAPDGQGQVVVEGHVPAQLVWKGEHPLARAHGREDALHQVLGLIGHAAERRFSLRGGRRM